HRVERLLAALTLGGPLKRLESLAKAAGSRRLEQVLLGAEETEHVGLRNARALRDRLRRRAVETALGELLQRRVENVVAPFLGALPLWLYDHAGDVSDYSQACQASRPPRRDPRRRAASGREARALDRRRGR